MRPTVAGFKDRRGEQPRQTERSEEREMFYKHGLKEQSDILILIIFIMHR